MSVYTVQLKKSIREKLECINDAEYLASLDAVLTYETISGDGEMPAVKKRSFLMRLRLFLRGV